MVSPKEGEGAATLTCGRTKQCYASECAMKKCSYCGRKNSGDAVYCCECGTEFDRPIAPPPPQPQERKQPEYTFEPLCEEDRRNDLVTIVRCDSLVAADLVASRLRAAGILTFIPDERLMQAVGFNFNTFGYVRVQVSPKDYDAARDLLRRIEKDG